MCFRTFSTMKIENKNEPEDVTPMKECTFCIFCIFRTLNDTHPMYGSMRSSTSRSVFLVVFCFFPLLVFFYRLFGLKIEWLWTTATKVKVFLDMLSSHSSANGRTDKRRKRANNKIPNMHQTYGIYPACADHFQMIAFAKWWIWMSKNSFQTKHIQIHCTYLLELRESVFNPTLKLVEVMLINSVVVFSFCWNEFDFRIENSMSQMNWSCLLNKM